MLPKVLVITSQPMPSDCALVHGCNGVAQCLWQTWDELRCDRLPEGTQLIIAHADPITEVATVYFQTLSATPGPPVLAVLPQSCDQETLELVSGAATDFLFSPLREDELRLRALRLLGTQPAELHALEDKLREDLRKISVATTSNKVPTVAQLTGGNHTVNVMPEPVEVETTAEEVEDD